MDKDYTQSFWVGFNNPRFPYARYGYLPALEEEKGISPKVETIHFTRYINHDVATSLYDRIAELQREVDDLKKRKIRKDIL